MQVRYLHVTVAPFSFTSEDRALDIPQQQPMTAEDAYERLQLWFLDRQKLAPMKSHEHLERVALVKHYFADAGEGTTRLDLGGGFDLKVQLSFNYKVDEGELDNVSADEIKALELPWDDLFVYKPTLNVKQFRQLNAEQTAFVQKLLTITDGSPQLEIVPRANAEGQQKHVEAAEAAKATAAPVSDEAAALQAYFDEKFPVVLKAEKAVEGSYYYDKADWWYFTNGEWVEVPIEAEDGRGHNVHVVLHKQHERAEASKPKRRGRPKKNKEGT